jgi:hypothetical protein
MFIDLTRNIIPKEYMRVNVVNNSTDEVGELTFTFNREAILGFATEMLFLYDDINDYQKNNITTHPLKTDPCPNQAIGFYLTPESPSFMLKINSLQIDNKEISNIENKHNIIVNNANLNEKYYINTDIEFDSEEMIIESYELSRRNILDISIKNSNGIDITDKCSAVVLEINKQGIKDFATSLLIWSNNTNDQIEYLIAKDDKNKEETNFGAILTSDSVAIKVRSGELGSIYDYDFT